MRDIRRPDSAEPIVERLTTTKISGSGQPIFATIMDLLIFSAGVGFAAKRRVPVSASGKAVPARIFENNQKEGFIYLVALAEKQDAATLGSEKDDEAAQIFEEYAAGGLEEITTWIHENPTDISGVQALIDAVQQRMGKSLQPMPDPDPV